MGAYSGDTGALVWIAHDNQFFDRYGLEVELVPFEAGKLAADALLSGQVDVATAAEFVVVSNSFDHPDLRIIATLANCSKSRLELSSSLDFLNNSAFSSCLSNA